MGYFIAGDNEPPPCPAGDAVAGDEPLPCPAGDAVAGDEPPLLTEEETYECVSELVLRAANRFFAAHPKHLQMEATLNLDEESITVRSGEDSETYGFTDLL